MKNFKIFYVFILVIISCTPASSQSWKMVWNEEFNYSGLPDSTKWSYDTRGNATGWGNNELQYYTEKEKDNAWVENGILTIKAIKREIAGKKYTSARLITKGKGDWLYGRFEIRARFSVGKGTWPAIWMLPTEWSYGNWPNSGEIDIMENVGFAADTVVGSVHTKTYNHIKGTQKSVRISYPESYKEFQVYVLEWDASEVRLYVNDLHYFTFKNENSGPNEWPFDKKFHLILNFAYGGNWGGMKGLDDTLLPHILEVDYVRVFQKQY